MTTHNTREGIETILLKWLEEEKKDNYVQGDLSTSYTLDGDFDISSLVEYLHQELQKARQDWLREEIESFKKEMQNYPMVNEQEWRNGYTEALEDQINRYHSELDQDKALQDNK